MPIPMAVYATPMVVYATPMAVYATPMPCMVSKEVVVVRYLSLIHI